LWIIVRYLENRSFITSPLHLTAQIFRLVDLPIENNMLTYLLLRDNKEAGPFSLDELLKLGLKPYDLVWISGRSAAWRYPSEINELKAYAPEVEEQPFDRFFKKPGAATADPVPVPEPVIVSAHDAYAPKVAVTNQPAYVAKKSVFVTLPGQQAEKKATPKPVPVPKPAPAAIPDYTTADAGETISITENPVARIKYSQPLDDIKEMYVKTLKDRKDRIARNSFMKVGLKRAAVVVGLIGVGVLAGFILKSKPAANSNLAQAIASPVVNSALTANTEPEAETIPETPAIPVNEKPSSEETSQQQKEHKPLAVPPPAAAMNTAINAELPAAKKETAIPSSNTRRPAAVMPAPQVKEDPAVQQVYSATEKDPVTGERTRAVRSEQKENTEQKAIPVSSKESSSPSNDRQLAGLGNQVSVSSNDYKRVALGGIRNLELTVTNRSKYELDQVMVELQYLKPSEQAVKTEMIQFKSIAANESATIRIPDTNRGVKVQFKIVRIGSTELVGNR
jgi:hypothetical protein